MRCAICNGQIDVSDPVVLPTTDGQHVHLRCAEREAHAAAQQRTLRAAVMALLLAGLFVLAIVFELTLRWIVILSLLLPIIHVSTNRRWWHYNVQPARLWWRMWRKD